MGEGNTMTKRRTSPEDVRRIVAHAQERLLCPACGAGLINARQRPAVRLGVLLEAVPPGPAPFPACDGLAEAVAARPLRLAFADLRSPVTRPTGLPHRRRLCCPHSAALTEQGSVDSDTQHHHHNGMAQQATRNIIRSRHRQGSFAPNRISVTERHLPDITAVSYLNVSRGL